MRGVDVRHYSSGADGFFAIATADFEPLPAGDPCSFAFVSKVPADRLPPALGRAFAQGVREGLCDGGPVPVVALRVLLRDARWHRADSTEPGFRTAGRKAAAEALRHLAPPA